MSVYLDGMRFNDGFGDTINWDLIPQFAISVVDIIPGSNPLFGLNTLGGALSVRTKRGFDNPGFELGASGGSWGRWAVEGEYGGSRGPFDWFLGFNVLNENGWRDESPSELRQAVRQGGIPDGADRRRAELHRSPTTSSSVTGWLPKALLAMDRSAVYTFPDETRNLDEPGQPAGSQWLTDTVLLSGNVFYRNYRRDTHQRRRRGELRRRRHRQPGLHGQPAPSAPGPLPGLGGRLLRCPGQPARRESRAGRGRRGPQDHARKPTTGARRYSSSTAARSWAATTGSRSGSRTTDIRPASSRAKPRRLSRPGATASASCRTGDFETVVDVATGQQNIGVYLADTFEITAAAGRSRWRAIPAREHQDPRPLRRESRSQRRPFTSIT